MNPVEKRIVAELITVVNELIDKVDAINSGEYGIYFFGHLQDKLKILKDAL